MSCIHIHHRPLHVTPLQEPVLQGRWEGCILRGTPGAGIPTGNVTEGRFPIAQSKEELHDKVYDSLRVQMVDELGDEMVDYHSYPSKATKFARKMRRAGERRREQRDGRKSSTNSIGGSLNQSATATRPRDKDKATHPNTEEGKESSVEKIETRSGSRAEQVTCYSCRKEGHIARDCAESKKSENKKVQQKDETTPASADETDSATDENSEIE